MVKASSCGNSSCPRFGSRFSQKSFFALFSYENEHSALWIYWRLIFYLSTNKTSSLFRDSCQDTQPIQPIFGRLFCLCTTGPQKGWMFYLLMGKKWISSRSWTTPDRWYSKFFFFGQLALPMMCGICSHNVCTNFTNENTNKYFVIPIQKFKTYVALDNCRPIVPNLGLGPGTFVSELCHLASDLE